MLDKATSRHGRQSARRFVAHDVDWWLAEFSRNCMQGVAGLLDFIEEQEAELQLVSVASRQRFLSD